MISTYILSIYLSIGSNIIYTEIPSTDLISCEHERVEIVKYWGTVDIPAGLDVKFVVMCKKSKYLE